MITAHLKGGLGNQMFQYARALARAKDTPVCLDVFEVEHEAMGDTKRPFALDAFVLGKTEIVRGPRRLSRKIIDRCMRLWKPDWGYFQSETYFMDEETRVRNAFTLRAPSDAYQLWEKRIAESSQTVSLHVRRGDYVHNKHVTHDFGLCSPAYYERAVAHITAHSPAATFFIFSDDIAWVKEHLPLSDTAVYTQDAGLSAAEELVLMSRCTHHIIANSSFSWWGAWLDPNPKKIVVAPTPWFDRARYNTHIIPASWIQLPK